MTRPIHATLTRCRQLQPLVVLDSEPFNGLEIRPADLLALADHLTEIANLANSLPTNGKHFTQTKVCLGLEEQIARLGLTEKQPTHKGA